MQNIDENIKTMKKKLKKIRRRVFLNSEKLKAFENFIKNLRDNLSILKKFKGQNSVVQRIELRFSDFERVEREMKNEEKKKFDGGLENNNMENNNIENSNMVNSKKYKEDRENNSVEKIEEENIFDLERICNDFEEGNKKEKKTISSSKFTKTPRRQKTSRKKRDEVSHEGNFSV